MVVAAAAFGTQHSDFHLPRRGRRNLVFCLSHDTFNVIIFPVSESKVSKFLPVISEVWLWFRGHLDMNSDKPDMAHSLWERIA